MKFNIEPTDRPLYFETVKRWGQDSQVIKAIEECSELIFALTLIQEKQGDMGNLADEIADVHIMCGQLVQHFGIEEAVNKRLEYKLKRLELMLAHGIEALDKAGGL